MSTLTVTDCSNDMQLQADIANAQKGNTITFHCQGSSDIVLSKTLMIDKNLTIDGTDQKVSLDGGKKVRVFVVQPSVQFILKNITVTNGRAKVLSSNGDYNGGNGGGLWNRGGTVTIDHSFFSANSAALGGGGIDSAGGTVTIDHSFFSANSAVTGGGIDSTAVKTEISNSTFFRNVATLGAGDGGGLFLTNSQFDNRWTTAIISNSTISNNISTLSGGGIFSNIKTVKIYNSTISNNTSALYGGGILAGGNGSKFPILRSDVTISNSTIAGNATHGDGGGVYLAGYSTMMISNSTIADNTAKERGGGILRLSAAGPLSIRASLVADNSTNCASSGRFNGPLTSLGYNLESATDCRFTTSTDQRNTDPHFVTTSHGHPFLDNNGGPTQTIALLQGSPAINKIPATATFTDDKGNVQPVCPTTDQRGFLRPNGFTSCDIGAYQSSYTAPPPAIHS
jgi:hypothetical protein